MHKKTDPINDESIERARMIAFNSNAASIPAKRFAVQIEKRILACEKRQRRRRPNDQASFSLAVEQILADLMLGYDAPFSSWVYRSLDNNSFIGSPVKAVTFKNVMLHLEELGFLERLSGKNQKVPFQGAGITQKFVPGLATRWLVKPDLIKIAQKFGVCAGQFHRHFLTKLPREVLKLRATSVSTKGGKVRGRYISFESSERTRAMEKQVRLINEYISAQKIEGASFNGFQRVFNQGDLDHFNWDLGGRLYAVGSDNFQQMKKVERSKIKINGSPVVEIDINASFLTILCSLTGTELPDSDDIYSHTGLPRSVVKAWITATLGHSGFHKRWPAHHASDLRTKGHKLIRMVDVEKQVRERFPVFDQWENSPWRWGNLMFLESEGVIGTVTNLMLKHDQAALPVHDSLIVPVGAEALAIECLNASFSALGVGSIKCHVNSC